MTGVITSLPPLVELPPGNNSSNPAGLPGVTYTAAIPVLPQTWTGLQTFTNGSMQFAGSTSGNTFLNATAIASGVLTLPAATDTLVARNTVDTLTNKTLTNPVINGGTISGGTFTPTTFTVLDTAFTIQDDGDPTKQLKFQASGISTATTRTLTAPDANTTLVGKDTTDTLTNKTFDTAGAGNSLLINGLAATANTGTGAVVRATSPTLVTPVLGVATATSFNGNIWTVGTGTLTLGAGKTATISNTLTFTGTDGSTAAFGAGGTVVYTSNNLSVFAATTSLQLKGVISDETGSGALVFGTSPNITTPTGIVKGDVGLGNVDNTSDATKWAATATLTNKTYDTAGAGNSLLINGVAVTANTGTGAVVRATSPTLVTPALGTPSSVTLTNATGLPLSGLIAQGAYTFVGNNSGSSAVPTAVDIGALTAKASPAGTDEVMIRDNAASGAWKRSTLTQVVGAVASGVSSIAGNTGAFTLSGLLTNSTNDLRVTAAIQSDMETGTSTAVAVVPGTQKFHPGHPKAWGFVKVTGGVPAISQSYNIASIVDAGVGNMTVNLTTAFSSVNFSVIGCVNPVSFGDCVSMSVGGSASQFSLFCGSAASGFVDPIQYHWGCFGDQ